MKKILSFFLLALTVVTLTACGNGEEPNEENGDNGTVTFSGLTELQIGIGEDYDPMAAVEAIDSEDGDITDRVNVSGTVDTDTPGTYTLTYTVTGSNNEAVTRTRTVIVLTEDGCAPNQELKNGDCVDIAPEVIRIMHGAPHEVDPFHENFSGTEQIQRQERQREVEQRLNVEVRYVNYPASAAWGPSRVTAIIQASVSGDPLADIYWSTSDWIQQLANGDAIAPIDQYLFTHGENIHADFHTIGSFGGKVYGFNPGNLTISNGLYYNADLVRSLGVANPTELYLDGEWNWSRFEQWASDTQTALSTQGDDMFALGGVLAFYAENMIPLNGGSLINAQAGRVAFHQNPALETYTFLNNLYTQGLFEENPAYDAGSPDWMAGKVAMHPGNFWFINADNRWGNIAFEIGFVPYPAADDYEGEYVSPVSGVALYHIASGMTPEREELVFQVWNELQLWKTEEEMRNEFEMTLLTRFDDELYVEAYIDVYNKIYLELINAVGISPYGENGWRANINEAIREGTARTTVDQIKPIYDAAVEEYFKD